MFLQAKPIFPTGKSTEKNVYTVLRATVSDLRDTTLSVTACYFYQVWVNGAFVSFGPARTAKGYARVDALPLDAYHRDGENEIIIAVIGHYCRSLSTAFQPSFVQAELRRGNDVLVATGTKNGFDAHLPACHVQKVKRYSVQRHFSEVWDLRDGNELLTPDNKTEVEILDGAPTPIERRAPYAYYKDLMQTSAASKGTTEYDETLHVRTAPYSFKPDAHWGMFEDDEIVYRPYEWVQSRRQIKTAGECALPVTLSESEYAIFDLSMIETGFIKLIATANADTSVIISFSEDATRDQFAFTNMNVYNSIELLLPAGKTVDWMSFEPYVGRYFSVAVRTGNVTLQGFGIKTFIHDPDGMVSMPEPEDPTLRAIMRGAIRTFNHNAVDLYTDCPSRERAGWLCDSYFTGKVEYAIYGNTMVEDAFLENFRIYQNEGEYPKGVLPMCYPSDYQNDRKFIPQWTMWYILEVEDYINRRGHKADRELFRKSIEDLLAFYKIYENADGLLERLPSWNFIEWSKANRWGTDVNYPTNFLYSGVLEACYNIYGDEELLRRSREVREKTIELSFDGTRFYDHSVRGGSGNLALQPDCSEIAQYYAIRFGKLDINAPKYEKFKHLVTKLCYADSTEMPADMEPINAFIGVYMRLEALLEIKEYDLVLNDVRAFFGQMEQETGTLWEYRQRVGSRDHGFASYALLAIIRSLNKE